MPKTFLLALSAAVLVSLVGRADAHTLLVDPPPLTGNDNAKTGPCGCYFGSPEEPNGQLEECPAGHATSALTPGAELTITFSETVNHDGSFRISFSPKPVEDVTVADFNGGVVLYEQADANENPGAVMSAVVTVPATPCEDCSIQLRQTMLGSADPYYYSCASVTIGGAGTTATSSNASSGNGSAAIATSAGAGGASSSANSGTAAGAGGSGTGPFSTGPGLGEPADDPPESGACAVGEAGSEKVPGALFVLASIGALAWVGRRHARPLRS